MTTPPLTARIVRTHIRHVRLTPIRHEFRYRSYSWLVDLDDLPDLPRWLRPFARFRAADHGDDTAGSAVAAPRDGTRVMSPGNRATEASPHDGIPVTPRRGEAIEASLREGVDTYLAEHGIDLRGGRVLMLANARVLGHVFNPLTVYWCRDRDGAPVCVIAEVHNTYGGRHRYLLRPDPAGRAETAKQFYVSPFNPVSGRYRISVPEPDPDLRISIVLHDDEPVFAASMTGRCRAATRTVVARAILEMPFAPLVVSARIRWQGLRLWARRLPVVPRTQPSSQEHTR